MAVVNVVLVFATVALLISAVTLKTARLVEFFVVGGIHVTC
jgi:hypothetical protein